MKRTPWRGSQSSNPSVSGEVSTQDSTEFVFSDGGYSFGPSSGQSSAQTYIYKYKDFGDTCYSRTLTAADLKLTKVENQEDCPQYNIP